MLGQVNSCGLAPVDLSGEAGEMLKKNLRAEIGDNIIRDVVRSCVCGQKSIVYAYTLTKVNKYCESCGAFESKQTDPV
jgi:hypothetical protein